MGTAPAAQPSSGWNGRTYGKFRSTEGQLGKQKRSPWLLILRLRSRVVFLCACIRHYFPRRQGNRSGPQLASLRHGRLTPARISPGCPPCLRLGLGRSIIIPDGVVAKQPATGCFVDGWDRSAPYLAVIDRGSIRQACKTERKNVQVTSFAVSAGSLQVVLAHPPVSLALVQRAPPGRYPDDRIFDFQRTREETPSLYYPLSEGVHKRIF